MALLQRKPSAPPPAYDFVEDDVDQKISKILNESLGISSTSGTAALGEKDEENYSESSFDAAYEAASRELRNRYGESSSMNDDSGEPSPSSTTSTVDIHPLHITKRSSVNSTGEISKDRLSLLAEEDLNAYPPPSHSQIDANPRGARELSHSNNRDFYHDILEDEAPPPFSPVGPSFGRNSVEGSFIMAPNRNDSPPPSPLLSPRSAHPALSSIYLPDRSSLNVVSHSHSQCDIRPSEQSSPVSPISPHPARQRNDRSSPAPAAKASNRPAIPQMNFDPAVVYARSNVNRQQSYGTNASAFYNSAVRPHLPTGHLTTQTQNISRQTPPFISYPNQASAHRRISAQPGAPEQISQITRDWNTLSPSQSFSPSTEHYRPYRDSIGGYSGNQRGLAT